MKRFSTFLIAALTLFCSNADPLEWTHPKVDVHPAECDCTVGAEGVIYHSMSYPSTPPTYYGSWVTFVSENEGDPVTISFTDFNCMRNSKPVVFVYDGDAELQANFTGYTKPAPEGYLAAITPENAAAEYTANSGKLCVLYAPQQAGSGSITGGYTAMVTAGTPHDMTFVDATAGNAGAAAWRGAGDVVLMALNIATDGTLNPFKIDNLTIDVAALVNGGKAENIRLYSSEAADASALVSTLGEGETTFTVTDAALKRNTPFTVVADIKPDVTGTLPLPSVTTLSVGGEQRTVDTSAMSEIEIDNRILIGNNGSHITYVISGDTPFFDGGGLENPIPLKSEGTVTFIPSPGSDAVKIDFSQFKLFDNSSAISVGNNDVMRVYNGREVNDDNLIATLITESKTVKSSAPDGSLTVYFKSVQGNESGRAAGWEATVSHFTPGPMTFESLTGEGSEEVAYAGQEQVVLLCFNVKTDNQLNALNVSEINLGVSAGLEAAAIEKASVYYLGEYKTASLSTLYGEVEFGSTGAKVSGSQTLREGDNYFAVAATISPEALNDMVGSMSLASVKVGSETATPAEEVAGSVMVSNHCAMTEGTHSHTLYSEWEFYSPAAPPTSYSDKYPAVNADHIVTFYPSEPGAVIEMEFSSFDVYYASNTWGTKAMFEIYSGDTTTASNLLWKLQSADDADKGPGKKLRSNAPNGAITVKFNPNTTSSYYTGTGWKGAVRQYFDHDATITKTVTTQASTSILAPGATAEPLIDFNVYTEGMQNPLTLSGVTLNVKGASQIKQISILSAGSKADFSNATVWGTAAPEADGTVTVSRAADLTPTPLADQDNYFRVTVDINDAVESDVAVDAALTGLSTENGVCHAVENGDPEGERLTKNIYIMQSGEQTVTVDKALMLYDDGGPEGNYTLRFNGSVTLVPAEGKIISVNTVDFGVGSGTLYVYSGSEAVKDNLIGKVTGYGGATGPQELYSKADDGSVTIVFEGASYTATSGFALAITPVDPVAHTIDTVVSEAATDEDVTRGSSDVALLHSTLTVGGNYGKLAISEIKADFNSSTNPADIVAASLYYTATTGSFSTAALKGEKVVLADGIATFALDEPIEIDEHGTYHLWIGADLSNKANPDNLASVSLSAITANGADVELGEQTAAGRHIITGMGGIYRIGSSEAARYKTIEAAVNSLKFGVEDLVMFQLEDGDYREAINIANVQGSSAEHPVIFTSLSGNRDAVRIIGPVSAGDDMVTVENSSHIHFRALTFSTESTVYKNIIHFMNSSRYGVIDNCVISSGAVTSGSTGTSLVRTESGSEANQNCDNFTIKDSYLENGYIALYLGGTSVVANPKDNGLTVSGNTIVNPYSKGLYVTDGENFTVIGNTITATDVNKSSYNGMDIYRPKGSFRIEGNKVDISMMTSTGSSSISATGIYLRGVRNNEMGSEDAANPAMLVNNVVNVRNSNNYSTYGIYVYNQIKNILVAHNTSVVAGSESSRGGYAMGCAGIVAPENIGIQVRNNIFQSLSQNAPLNVWDDGDYTNITFSGNVYYGGNGNVDNQSPAHTFEEYTTLSGDQTSLWNQVSFVSDTDLHLLEASENLAMPRIEGVGTDADGKERPEATTAGAYEFAEISQSAPEIAEGYPVVASVTDVSAVVRTMWSESGQLYSLVLTEAEAVPTADDLKGGRPTAIEAGKEVTTNLRMLDQLTAYKAYFLAVSALGVESEIVASAPFTTLETIDPLTVEIDFDTETAVAEGSTVTLEAMIAGGKEPYAISWTDQMGDEIGTDDILTREVAVNGTYRVAVTSADGQIARAKAPVRVLNAALKVAGFDDLHLEDESHWKYDTTLDEDEVSDIFFSGSFCFPNYPWFAYESWGGYAYSNETSTEFRDYNDQFRNCVGSGAAGTRNFGVAYMPEGFYNMAFDVAGASDEGLEIPGMYVTNSAYALNSILNGDSYVTPFSEENGDYLTLKVEGLDANGTLKASVEVPLADYRAGEPAANSARNGNTKVLTEWKWVDLSPLGKVSKLRFSYDSSQKTYIPAYVCFDEVGAKDPALVGLDTPVADVLITVPVVDVLSVSGIECAYSLHIYSTDGILRASHELCGASAVSIASLDCGTYIAEIVGENGNRTVHRFIKR